MIRETLATFTTVEKTQSDIAALIETRAFFIAERSGQLAGFATYGPFRTGPGYAATAEHSVIVAAPFHGTGVGRALMTAVEAHAVTDKIHTLVGAVSSANPGAIAFHEALGYRVAGRLTDAGRKADQWLDLVLMQKILAAPD